ncbi:Nitrilase family, member 2 [Seminavis robusta]|uniref:Nitrilase family, member 2 n=1 Tax=Seminavis robusta TaxID=568900 RepID=A0A9N8DLK6_9STRA|nr:Nitrilase family, member 2 [Seminavis robusta]|eukprot:Sro149_g068300.1 Nitrilase family, member 2 (234) ;mRNA; f:7761-8462
MLQMDFPTTLSNSRLHMTAPAQAANSANAGQQQIPFNQQHGAGYTHQLATTERIDPCALLNTFGSKKAKKLLPPDFRPSNYTVLVGRTRECQEHAGNRRLRAIVNAHLQQYNEAPDKLEKTAIVTEVYNQVRAATAIGHFVKLEKGRFYEVGERTARERIGAMFRDSLSCKYKSSAKNKVAARMVKKSSRTSQDSNGSMRMAANAVQQYWEDHSSSATTESGPAFEDFSNIFD